MSELQAPTNRDLLCVTPHEDEGYLSPSEEDLKRSLLAGRSSGFLNCKQCKPSNSLGSCVTNYQDQDEDPIEWEEISRLPYTKDEHLSWDRLKIPVPYRFYDEHRSCLRQVRRSTSTLHATDNAKNHAQITSAIWRSYGTGGMPSIKSSVTAGAGGLQIQSALKKVRSVNEEPISISPKEFVQHIFHLLCGRESVSFCRVANDKYKFTRNPRVLVVGMSPGLVENLSKPYVDSGRIYKRLMHMAALHYDEKLMEKEGFNNNSVITAFLKFNFDYLKLYQTSLMLKASSISSLSMLQIFFKPFHYQLETLEKILDLYLSTNQDQIILLKGLNTMMLCSETPYVADLLRSAFITCAAAYLRYVADWIFRGTLTKGFHVQRTKAFTYQDRRYWVKQFSQITSVPKFLDKALNIIFETGKAINLLNLIRNTQKSTSLFSCILHDEGTTMLPVVEFPQVTVLEKEWQIKLESFFEEYSFLQEDIDAALVNANSEQKENQMDFEAIEDAKKTFDLKKSATRREILDRKLQKQKELYDTLSQQVAEKRDREKQEVENDQIENKQISSFLQKRDQRDLNEEIRLKKKHFGEQLGEQVADTVGVRNVKERIAATQIDSGNGNTLESTDSSIALAAKQSEAENIVKTDSLATFDWHIFDTDSEVVNPLKIQAIPQVCDVSARSDTIDHHDLGVTLDDKISDENPSADLVALSSLSPAKEFENKFDSSNLKVRSSNPYNIDLDFESSAFLMLPQPILKRSATALVPCTEEQSSLRHDSFFLNFFFQQSAIIPVKAQNRMVNSAILHYFIVEKKLFYHIEALNSYLCLQNGLFGHFLTTLFIQEVKNGALASKDDIPKKTGRLHEILGEAIILSAESNDSAEIRDNLGFILARENNRSSMDLDAPKPTKSKILTSKYEVLDDITLNYSVDWPLSILLTEDLLINYEKLFTFLMKLYRTELLLLEMFSVLKFKGLKSRQLASLHYFRYRMLHFVRSVRHYINVTVIHCAWTELVASFPKMNSLDKLYEGLVRHIKFVTTNCLLGTKGEAVKKLLVDQLIVIECFCVDVEELSRGINWQGGEEIHPRRFAKLEQKFKVYEEIQKVFLQVFFKLADKGIYQKVSYFLQLFNFNEYFGNNSSAVEQ